MSPPDKPQKKPHHIVSDYGRISPDDVLTLLRERDRLAAADTRDAAARHLGDPPPGRSAWAEKQRQQKVADVRKDMIAHLRHLRHRDDQS
jgi:hypothetical protein